MKDTTRIFGLLLFINNLIVEIKFNILNFVNYIMLGWIVNCEENPKCINKKT